MPPQPRTVLLIHTGGTLGMRGAPLEPGAYADRLTEAVPELGGLARLETRILCNLDSSDVGPEEWSRLALEVESARSCADGVVIIHGTDTMAYTASALAFALVGLDRPVILTGAQRPLAALRTDARRNLVDAVELATADIPEVGICFDGLLLRGCRTVKCDARSYHAFESPGCPLLARLGFDIEILPHLPRPGPPFRCDSRFDPRVMVLYVTPGLEPDHVRRLLDRGADLRGLVLAAFGVGTVPSERRPLAPVIRRAVEDGVEVVLVTQRGGIVDLGLYRNSLALLEAGAISGGKMTIEAAVAKLMHALACFPAREERRRYLEADVAGERE